MEEVYKVIQGYENYSVSNFGNVINNKTGKTRKPQSDKYGYRVVHLNGKLLKIHRLVANAFIANPHRKPHIDHIDNNRNNNISTNLRYVTQQENCFNHSVSSANTSGHKGISLDKKTNKWCAYIMHNYKKYHLGYFDKIEDAINERQKKANEIYGEFTNASEKIVNLNIMLPKTAKLNINIKIEENDEDFHKLEKEFEEIINR
jgi:hypothetical protein